MSVVPLEQKKTEEEKEETEKPPLTHEFAHAPFCATKKQAWFEEIPISPPHFAWGESGAPCAAAAGASALGCPVIARTRSQVLPAGFTVRGDAATSAGMGMSTEWLFTMPTLKPV